MAVPAADCLCFQRSEVVTGFPGRSAHQALPALHPAVSRTLPRCEKAFRSRSEGLGRLVWQAIVMALLLYSFVANASDLNQSCAPDLPESGPSTPATVSPTPVSVNKEAGKYDVDRIGQRNTGKGANLYSLEKERSLGQAMATAFDWQTKFITAPEIHDYIDSVAQKLVRHSDAQVPFTVKVIDSSSLSTFALPGGFLYVDKGLIMEVDNEAELAGLMAHEIAHVAARHATRFATRKYAWNIVALPITFITGPAAIGAQQLGPLSLSKFNRDAEMEADLLGLEYQYAAGYDPQAFVDAMEKLHAKERRNKTRGDDRSKSGFWSHLPFHQVAGSFANYPPTEERILRLQTEISTLLACRDDYISDTSEFQEVKAQLGADRPVLHRHRPGDGPSNGPVLRRHPSSDPLQPPQLRAHTATWSGSGGF